MGKSLYLINPAAGVPGYWGAAIFSGLEMTPTIAIADLAIATVAQVRFMYEGGQFWEPTLAPDAGAIWQARRLDNSAIPARSPGLMPAS